MLDFSKIVLFFFLFYLFFSTLAILSTHDFTYLHFDRAQIHLIIINLSVLNFKLTISLPSWIPYKHVAFTIPKIICIPPGLCLRQIFRLYFKIVFSPLKHSALCSGRQSSTEQHKEHPCSPAPHWIQPFHKQTLYVRGSTDLKYEYYSFSLILEWST